MKRRNIEIYGPFINEVIWEQIPDDSCLWLRMLYKDVGEQKDNVLADYAKIDNSYQYSVRNYQTLFNWIRDESEDILKLGENTKLYVISSETFEDCDTYPSVFQNNIKFSDNKLSLFLKYETMVFNKVQITSLASPLNHYSYGCPYTDTIALCEKYNVKLDFLPLLDHLYCDYTLHLVCVVCNGNQTTFLGKCFTDHSTESIVIDPFPAKINGQDYSISIDTKRVDFSDKCDDHGCPISKLNKVLKLRHFHSCAILTDYTNKYLLPPANTKGVREYSDNAQLSKYFAKLIVLEHQNVDFLINHSDILNMNYDKTSPIDIDIDFGLFSMQCVNK
jgi:hypothetical protein